MEIETTEWQESPVAVERPVFAIGDVHGQLNLLMLLHNAFEKLVQEYQAPSNLLVHIGDYIDRGENSFLVLQRVIEMQKFSDALYAPNKVQIINLAGNHEQMMLNFFAHPENFEILSTWLVNGGTHTLTPYMKNTDNMPPNVLCKVCHNALMVGIGEHLTTITEMLCAFREGDLLFTHAGVPRGMEPNDLLNFQWVKFPQMGLFAGHPLWVREPFLSNDTRWQDGTIVVHGHTRRKDVEIRKTRINIDTGAYASGRLTMVEFNNNSMRFHTANSRGILDRNPNN